MIPQRAARPFALLAATLVAIAVVSPAGMLEPSRIRVATVEGVSGPVYYSLADRRFLPILSLEARAATQPELVADNAF